jgi:hypothetical protein
MNIFFQYCVMKAPLSINPEQTPGFSLGKAEGLI